MFIRTVWRLKRLVDLPQHFREMSAPTGRFGDDGFAVCRDDFAQMTRSVFDTPRRHL